jgi:Glycosyltransferase sugar-binding region containing DXD motif
MIKQAYFYWATEVLPWVRFLTLKTFRQYHPDWDMYLYVPPTWIKATRPFTGKDYFGKVGCLGVGIRAIDLERVLGVEFPVKNFPTVYADIFRYVILDRFGGFYSDMDQLYFNSVDFLDCYNATILPTPYHHFLYGKPNNPYFKRVLAEQLSHLDEFTTNYLVTTSCTQHLSPLIEENVSVLPLITTEDNLGPGGPTSPYAVCLDWHGSGWHERYSLVTEENYLESDHPLSAVIRFCLHNDTKSLQNISWINRGEYYSIVGGDF